MIPRAQRTCLTCIYGGEIIGGDHIECRRTQDYLGNQTNWWCGEGQWEEIVDRGDGNMSFHTYWYNSRPTPLTEEMW